MTVFRYEIPLSLTLVSPFATRGPAARDTFDLPLARNEKNELILPSTLICGVVRAALARLAEELPDDARLRLEAEIRALFGSGSRRDSSATQAAWQVANEPSRGQLAIRDLVLDEASAEKELQNAKDYPRIQIDECLGSVNEGFLQFVELPFLIGDEVTFTGTVDLNVGTVAPERAQTLLRKALALVPAIGAIKSSGFGRVACSNVSPAIVPIAAAVAARRRAAGALLQVTYSMDRPFLVGGRMASANLFEGSPVIPGGAIKGTLAEALTRSSRMTDAMRNFVAGLTVGHAFPRPASGQRSWQPLPLSVATATHEQAPIVFDRLLATDPEGPLRRSGSGKALTLSYFPDIKDRSDDSPLRAQLGLDCKTPSYVVRTRTKIDAERGNAAFEDGAGQLFSYAAVSPSGFVWVGRWVLPEDTDATLADEVEAFLRQGIVGLGKTGALLKAESIEVAPAVPVTTPPYALTLMTSAALNDVDTLRRGCSLADDYAAYWQCLGYTLKQFFASQQLVGGYAALRYPPKTGRCEPYLLTEAGSVFLVEPAAGARPIEQLLAHGLPPTDWIDNRTWQGTPFLPTNGFGEVRLNVVDHQALLDGQTIEERGNRAA